MTEAPAERGVQICDACDSEDTDPMVHVSHYVWQKDARTMIVEPSFHHDCLPQELRDQLVGPDHAVARAIIEAAESGTRGDALHDYIQTLDHSVQQPSLATQEG